MTVFVNAIMYYKVANAIHAVANVDDYSGSSRLFAATTLRNVLRTMNLGEILSQRESIAREMRVCKFQFSIENRTMNYLGDSGCCYRALGSKSRKSRSKRCSSSCSADEGYGSRS